MTVVAQDANFIDSGQRVRNGNPNNTTSSSGADTVEEEVLDSVSTSTADQPFETVGGDDGNDNMESLFPSNGHNTMVCCPPP